MAVRPILFSTPMVRALLVGTKTQTRRVLTRSNTLFNGSPWPRELVWDDWRLLWKAARVDGGPSPAGSPGPYLHLPYGPESQGIVARIYPLAQPGDLLWVRESVTRFARGTCDQWVWYHAGQNDDPYVLEHFPEQDPNGPWDYDEGPGTGAPYNVRSIHMPRWASRLTLRVTNVRLQRLQDICREDVIAEGVTERHGRPLTECVSGWHEPFADLWDEISGPGSWAANPWVAAISFDVIRQNVDAIAKEVA